LVLAETPILRNALAQCDTSKFLGGNCLAKMDVKAIHNNHCSLFSLNRMDRFNIREQQSAFCAADRPVACFFFLQQLRE
jgi:hypothetical protein